MTRQQYREAQIQSLSRRQIGNNLWSLIYVWNESETLDGVLRFFRENRDLVSIPLGDRKYLIEYVKGCRDSKYGIYLKKLEGE